MFVGRYDPGSKAAGLFSALFVNLIPQAWPVLADLIDQADPRRGIWNTLIVRLLAVGTGVLGAFVVDLVLSAPAPARIVKLRLYFAEKQVRQACSGEPSSAALRYESAFNAVTNLLQEVSPVIELVERSWVFGGAARTMLRNCQARAQALFRYLTFMSFLRYLEESQFDAQEIQLLAQLGRAAYHRVLTQDDMRLFNDQDSPGLDLAETLIPLSRTLQETAEPLNWSEKPVICWGRV